MKYSLFFPGLILISWDRGPRMLSPCCTIKTYSPCKEHQASRGQAGTAREKGNYSAQNTVQPPSPVGLMTWLSWDCVLEFAFTVWQLSRPMKVWWLETRAASETVPAQGRTRILLNKSSKRQANVSSRPLGADFLHSSSVPLTCVVNGCISSLQAYPEATHFACKKKGSKRLSMQPAADGTGTPNPSTSAFRKFKREVNRL